MAGCDSGYFCIECEEYVPSVVDSELYLRYVLGEIPMEALKVLPDRHLRCNPAVAQYIVAPGFEPVVDDRPEHDKRRVDRSEAARREDLVTRAWRRLQALPGLALDVADYPLAGVIPPTIEEFFGGGQLLPREGPESESPLSAPDGRIFY